MAEIQLHNVEDAVEEIVRGVESASSGGTWSVLGEPTAGKSAVLERLCDYFKQEGTVRPVLVTPPPRAYDAAHAALIDLAEGLELNQTALAAIQDPQTAWSSKLQRVGNALRREGRVVLLLDEPDSWSPLETYFTEFVRDIWNLVFDRVGLTTVTAGSTPFLVRGHHAIRLDPASNPDAVLAAIDAPALRAAKDAVAFRFQTSLPSVSPLQIRLLVAIAALSEPGMASTIGGSSSTSRLMVRLSTRRTTTMQADGDDAAGCVGVAPRRLGSALRACRARRVSEQLIDGVRHTVGLPESGDREPRTTPIPGHGHDLNRVPIWVLLVPLAEERSAARGSRRAAH